MIEKIKEIYDVFDTKNIIICGSLADYYWIDENNIADTDFIVSKEHFFNLFELSDFKGHLYKHGFSLDYRVSDLYGNRYQGYFKHIKVEFYPRDNINIEKFVEINGYKFYIDKTIKIHSINKRIEILREHLTLKIHDDYPEWKKIWIKIKKEKAKYKLKKYYQLKKNFI